MKMGEPCGYTITAQLLLSILGGELYADHDHSLWEIVRNAVCACMPNEKQWVAGAGDVDIFLREHPLAPDGTCLIVLDHGKGFSDEGFKRFFTLGASKEDIQLNPEGMHGGASQKRIGRFAALALNLRCFRDKDGSSGFHILTRRASRGDVVLIPVIPDDIERTQRSIPRTVPGDAPELGFLKGTKGSFTAFVIAHSVFSSYAEIRDALRWRVPRRKDQMFKLIVGGELLTAPPLASEHCNQSPDGTIEMHLERVSSNKEPGIWFADSGTGLRVACAKDMSSKHVPYPFFSPDLSGDIFVPGILAKQGTSRSGLASSYLHSQSWLRVHRYLVTQAETARGLLGEGAPKPRSPARASLAELAEICNRVFGPPEIVPGEDLLDITVREDKIRVGPPPDILIKRRPVGGKGGTRPPKGDGGEKPPVRKRPLQRLRIGDKTYVVVSHQTDPLTLVKVDSGRIYLNDAYALHPARHDARDEHVWSATLYAVAYSETPDSPFLDIVLKVSKWRKMLFK